jgi:hypothetical protein
MGILFNVALKEERRGALGMSGKGERGGVEEMALTVAQGVAFKPIQIFLVQYLGQLTATDGHVPIYSKEAADALEDRTVLILRGEKAPGRACGFCLTDFLLVFSESVGNL